MLSTDKLNGISEELRRQNMLGNDGPVEWGVDAGQPHLPKVEILDLPDEDVVETFSPAENVFIDEPEIDFSSNVIDMTTIKEGEEHKIISMAVKNEFNPNSTQNALADEEDEGGVYGCRSTHHSLSSSNQGGSYTGKTVQIESGKVELSGFKVVVNYGNGDQGIDVRAMFNNVETAKASINGDKFIFFDNGGMKIGTIVSGAPCISNDEREIAKFVNGNWTRA